MLGLRQHMVDSSKVWEEYTCGCWGWAGWLGSETLLVGCLYGESGEEGVPLAF